MVMCITGLWLRGVLLIFCGLVRGFAGAYGVLKERLPVMVNGRKSLFLGIPYIYIMCDSWIEGKYMKNSQRKMACGIGLSLVSC